MLLDRSHRPWIAFSAACLLASTAAYVWYARTAPSGPSGGSAAGLAFGIAGTAFMLFAALLGVRKRRPHYRWGRASTWLKGHLWLGARSFPLILFHGGFAFGGPLTRVLMWIFILVFVTGLLGLALQQLLPRFMTKSLPQETVYEQIDHVREQLLAEAVELARGVPAARAGVSRAKSGGRVQGRIVESRAVQEREGEEEVPDRSPLLRFLDRDLRPYFGKDGVRGSPLAEPSSRAALFDELRRLTDPRLHGVVEDLEAYCEQREQLDLQRRLHLWLHAWLLVHVPLSWTMVFLTVVHAVMSLSY